MDRKSTIMILILAAMIVLTLAVLDVVKSPDTGFIKRCVGDKEKYSYLIEMNSTVDYSDCEAMNWDDRGRCVQDKMNLACNETTGDIVKYLKDLSVSYELYCIGPTFYLKNITNEQLILDLYHMFSSNIKNVAENCYEVALI